MPYTPRKKIDLFSAEKYDETRRKVKHFQQFFYLGMKNTSKFSEEMLYILSALKFMGSLLAFHGGNVHFRLIPPKNLSLGTKKSKILQDLIMRRS